MHFQTENRSDQIIVLRTCLIGSISLVLMLFLSVKSVLPAIEKELLQKVYVQLLESKLDNILVTAEGQDIYLEGLVTDETRSQALLIANNVYGVRTVHDQFTLTDQQTPD